MSKEAVCVLGVCVAVGAAAQTPTQPTIPTPSQVQAEIHGTKPIQTVQIEDKVPTHTVVAGRTVLRGIFKAPAMDNHTNVPGIDCKFTFAQDGTFQFVQKTMEGTVVTHGSYEFQEGLIELKPARQNANWPTFWTKPAELTENASGALIMKDLTFEPSLIGKAFTPGLYRCEKNPTLRYYFNPQGGYKYTGNGNSTGEYWVEKTTDPASGEERAFLILNILRVDGKRVNFHQRIDLGADGSFNLEKKYTYKKAAS